MEENKIYYGDCMELMKQIDDKKVDMILCDLPYGTTQNEWDINLPLKELWEEYKRIIKDTGVIVLTSDSIFSAKLIMSNPSMYKYSLIWDKIGTTGFLNANKMPLRRHEDILVFYKQIGTYNPIMESGKPYRIKHRPKTSNYGNFDENYGTNNKGQRYPTSVISIYQKRNPNGHPTQKPVELFRYLIKTYTNEGDLVLDNCIGSGTTAVACKQTNRRYMGIENNQDYVNMANKRLNFTTVGDFNPLNEESLISVKRESADSPNSPHDSSTNKEEANFS